MASEANIEAWSVQAGVRVLFGTENLVERLTEVVATCTVYSPPSGEEIVEEVELLMPGVMPENADNAEVLEFQGRHVIIQHAAVVNFYTDPE